MNEHVELPSGNCVAPALVPVAKRTCHFEVTVQFDPSLCTATISRNDNDNFVRLTFKNGLGQREFAKSLLREHLTPLIELLQAARAEWPNRAPGR